MPDGDAEPSMEEILSSIKRVIEENDAPSARPRRIARASEPAAADPVLELNERVGFPAVDPSTVHRAPPTPATPPTPQPPTREDIVSQDAAAASRGALEALSRLVVKPDQPGADTLEGLVREMLRPMLREWLDAQLPAIVEAMVAKEIARISGR